MRGICRLCQADADLKESHIIPRFVTDWIKRGSATGYLREPTQPNRRAQDGRKLSLLCAACELRFSRWEELFASTIFVPFQSRRRLPPTRYGDWFKRFVVSLNWRVAIALAPIEPLSEVQADLLERATNLWRKYLLDEVDTTDPGEHHVVFVGPVSHTTHPGMSKTFNRSTMMGVDPCIFHSRGGERVGVYTKLPSIVLCSFVSPPAPEGWEGTKIATSGVLQTPQSIKDNGIFGLMIEREARVDGMIRSQLSPRQLERIERTIAADPTRALNSVSYEALMHDEVLTASRRQQFSRVGRNEPCPCGSGKKWKRCCYAKL